MKHNVDKIESDIEFYDDNIWGIALGNLNKELTKAINDEIFHEMIGPRLREEGWYYLYSPNHNITDEWHKNNTLSEYKVFGGHYYFKDPNDAATFQLHWKESK